MKKQTFLRVREKCKTFMLYLYDGKRDQAVAYIVEANENFFQYFTEFAHIITSSTKFHPSIREKCNLLIGPISSSCPQIAKAYVDMRLDLYTLFIVSKSPSWDKVVEIMVTYNDQINKAILPFLHGISALMQTFFTVFPNHQNNVPTCVQAAVDILSSFQLDDSSLGFYERFDLASSYVSQNQGTLSNASYTSYQ